MFKLIVLLLTPRGKPAQNAMNSMVLLNIYIYKMNNFLLGKQLTLAWWLPTDTWYYRLCNSHRISYYWLKVKESRTQREKEKKKSVLRSQEHLNFEQMRKVQQLHRSWWQACYTWKAVWTSPLPSLQEDAQDIHHLQVNLQLSRTRNSLVRSHLYPETGQHLPCESMLCNSRGNIISFADVNLFLRRVT